MQITSQQRFIYKIHTSRLKKSNWNLNVSIQEAQRFEELVPLSESTTIRFIDMENDLNNQKIYSLVKSLEKQIKNIKKQPTSIENRRAIKFLYDTKYEQLIIKDYICLVMDSNSDYDRANRKKGFYINGIKYKELLGTTGGIKNSVIVYISEKLHNQIENRINNGRNPNKEFVPAKLAAYRALTCSSSIPVSSPKGVLVVKDCITKFNARVIKIDDTKSEYPIKTISDNEPIELVDSDGYGLICPNLSKRWTKELGDDYISSGFCIRNAFCKGMVFTFDYELWAKEMNNGNYMVEDTWGNWVDVRTVEIILTISMLKLWDSYDNIEHYLECCNTNGYTFSVTKNTPKKLENQRETNYQFLQSLYLNSDMIDDLVKPTIKEIRDVMSEDYRKSILFLKGTHLDTMKFKSEECDFIKALMIDKRMIKDPYVLNKIHTMIKKKITEAKIGVLKVQGNYSIISGDPYSLVQSIFGHEVKGLLEKGEFYSHYWNELKVDKVACFRAPMTCHNNVRVLNLKNTKDMQKWYKHMTTVTIFNSWDTTTHALNGADKDSDAVFQTNNETILQAIIPTDAIFCVQKSAKKTVPTAEDFTKSNKDGFGDEIGTVTNHITSMFDVLARYEIGSKEYEEIMYRIMCGQNYQQNAIDKIKGIVCKPMPKCWYDNRENTIKDDDFEEVKKVKLFNQSIVADKNPEFFKYIYPHRMKAYKSYIDKTSKNCLMRFSMTLSELIEKQNKSDDEELFLKWYYIKMPLSQSNSVMNKICWRIEKEFDGYKPSLNSNFDYTILKTDKQYTKGRYSAIKKLYAEYNDKLRVQSQLYHSQKIEKEERQTLKKMFGEQFKIQAYELCNDAEELCNIVIDLCYKNNNSKQFAWDICGDIIINNLLKNNNYSISYPILDSTGDIEFGGEKFSMITMEVKNEDNLE